MPICCVYGIFKTTNGLTVTTSKCNKRNHHFSSFLLKVIAKPRKCFERQQKNGSHWWYRNRFYPVKITLESNNYL